MDKYNKRIDLEEEKRRTTFHNGRKDISKLGAGDSFYIAKFYKKGHQEIFQKILEETNFIQMFHIGKDQALPIPRLVTAQADHFEIATEKKEDTEKKEETEKVKKSALYRMPGCNEKNIPVSDWTPTVKKVCELASEEINQKLNHCVLTLFQNEDDSLGFHQDKILYLNENSLILSISFGEARPIQFHSLNGKDSQTILLRPGSLLAIGPKTNKMYVHGIPKLTESVGPRVSLSLRTVDTFIQYKKHSKEDLQNETENFEIVGKGSDYQTKNYPFIKSHDDPENYSETVKKQIESVQNNIN